MRRAVVLGVSGLSPDLVEHFLDGLPVLKQMREKGVWGRLESNLPPVSSPAWTSALSGKNSGAFGVWGLHGRSGYSYALDEVVNSELINSRIRPLYRVVSKLGQRVGTVNLPWTDSETVIPGGFSIGSSGEGLCTFPETFANEVRQVVGDYKETIRFSETRRRDIDRRSRLPELKKADEQRFSLVKHLVQEKLCDIVMAVFEGAEAASHLFLRDADSGHVLHDPKSKDREVLGDYYRFIDQQVGEVMSILDDDTVLCLFSVSSVQRLDGMVNLNEWLIQKGYLKLKAYPDGPVSLEEAQVDWSATKAWAMGETGQIYINVKGKEKEGVVNPKEYSALLGQLIDDVENMVEAKGKAVPVEVYRGNDLYFGEYAEIGPDLLLHLDEGRWRTEQRVGFGRGEIINTESMKDEVMEGLGRQGYMSICGSDFPAAGEVKHVSIRDLAPTLIDIMNLRAPYSTIDYEMDGCSLLQLMGDRAEEEKIVQGEEKESEEDKVRSRLEALGY